MINVYDLYDRCRTAETKRQKATTASRYSARRKEMRTHLVTYFQMVGEIFNFLSRVHMEGSFKQL